MVMRVCGDLSLAPTSVAGAAARLMAATATLEQPRARANICFSYTAREEAVQAVDDLMQALGEGQLEVSDITPTLVKDCLRTQVRGDDCLMMRNNSMAMHFFNGHVALCLEIVVAHAGWFQTLMRSVRA